MEAAIQAAGPSFRDVRFCTGGGYFLGRLAGGFGASICRVPDSNVCIGRPGFDLELVFVTFQKAMLGSGGGYPSTRSVLQGHAALHWLGKRTWSYFWQCFRRQRWAVEAAIQAPGLSFRGILFCTGGGSFFGRLARGLGASFGNVPHSSVRQWRRASKHQVCPSGKIVQSSRRWGMGAHAPAMSNMKLNCLPQPPLRRCFTRPVLTVLVIMSLQNGHVYW